MTDATLLAILTITVTVLAPAVGWLVTAVIAHGKQIAALAEAQKAIPTIAADLRTLVGQNHELAVGLAEVGGDVKALRERTEAVLRTVDRHERFLERQGEGNG